MRYLGPGDAAALDAYRRVFAPQARGLFPLGHWSLGTAIILSLAMSLLLGPSVAAVAAAPTATACLVDSNGTGIEGAQASYYASGWKTIGTTGADGCVSTEAPEAAARTTFRVAYNGQSQEVTQNTATDPTVTFTTNAVTTRLLDSTGAPIEGGVVTYYASGWKTLGTTDTTGTVTGQLIAARTTFRVAYNGQSQEVTQNTATDPTITFQTGRVKQGLGQQVQSWYASGWRTFTDGVELLPGRVSFSLNDAPTQVHTVVAGDTIYVPIAPNAPRVTAGADQDANEGDVVAIEATFTDQEISESHSATVTWGDGSAPRTADVSQTDGLAGVVTAQHRYGNDGDYTVEVCVTDNGSITATGCSALTVSVANVAPEMAGTGLPDSVSEGNEVAPSVAVAAANDGDGGTSSVDTTVTATNVLSLLTSETAAIVEGDTSWVALNWQAGQALEDFRVEVSSAGAARVTYSETTGNYAGPYQSPDLAAGEIDFTSLRIHVPYEGTGDAATIPLQLVASWSAGSDRHSLVFDVVVPIARPPGDDLRQVTDQIELATGAGAWVEVAYEGLTPAASNFAVVVAPNPDLPVTYPADGPMTSLSNDAVLEDGEIDVARFYLDTTGTPPGRYVLVVNAAYSKGAGAGSFEGTVTVEVTP